MTDTFRLKTYTNAEWDRREANRRERDRNRYADPRRREQVRLAVQRHRFNKSHHICPGNGRACMAIIPSDRLFCHLCSRHPGTIYG